MTDSRDGNWPAPSGVGNITQDYREKLRASLRETTLGWPVDSGDCWIDPRVENAFIKESRIFKNEPVLPVDREWASKYG